MSYRILIAAVVLAVSGASASAQNPFLGKWNISGTGQDAANVYWLEVKEEAGQLTGMFLDRVANPNPVSVRVENGELIFQGRNRQGQPSGAEYRARLDGGKLVGSHKVRIGGRGRGAAAAPADPAAPPPPTERDVNWVGVRPPSWGSANANAKHAYGAPIVLFDGKTMDAWDVQHPTRPLNWSVADGLMFNTPSPGNPSNNLVSKQKFQDFKIEAEYVLEAGSNSGIYIRGRYELQLLDDFGKTDGRADLGHMAIYGRTAPSVNASKPAGEWQTMEAVVVGNRVTVKLNGTTVHDNAVIEGVTGGTLDNAEATPGPLLVQGDHSKVKFRRIVVTPIK